MITRATLSTIEQGLPKYRSMLAGNAAYMPSSFESIASATGTGSSNTITFSSLPTTYKHLQIRGVARMSAASTDNDAFIRFNGTTSGSTYYHSMGMSNTTTSVGAFTEQRIADASQVADSALTNNVSPYIIDIYNYQDTNKNKTTRIFQGYQNNTAGKVYTLSNVWFSNNAITSISLIAASGSNWTTQTTFALYGIKGS